MKKYLRRVQALALALILCLGLATPALAAKVPITTVRSSLKNGTRYLSDYGISRQAVVEHLSSHLEDNFYLTTPYASGDWQSPLGDTAYNGTAGMNCAGFVSYVLRAAGMEAHVEEVISTLKAIKGNSPQCRSVSSRYSGYQYLASAANYYLFAKTVHLVSHVYASKEKMLNDGLAEKGDIIVMYWNRSIAKGENVDNHIGFFWGDDPHDDKLWHSTDSTASSGSPVYGGSHWGNQISQIIPEAADATYILIKLEPPRAKSSEVPADQTDTAPTAPPQDLPPAADAAPAVPTIRAFTQKVNVDGEDRELACCAQKDEKGNNTYYIRLRDLAMLLNGSAAQFDVGWDGGVTITTKTAYTPNGSELSTPFSGDRAYRDSGTVTRVDGETADLAAVLLKDDGGGGHTYYRLRDLGKGLNFNVGWTAEKGVFLETDKPYDPDN